MPDPREFEEAVLGAAMVVEKATDDLASELRLAPEHFWLDKHRAIWGGMLGLRDRNEAVNALTVCGAVNGAVDHGYVHQLQGTVPSPAHYLDYGRRVIRFAEWRKVQQAATELHASAESMDDERRNAAERLLQSPTLELASLTLTPEQWTAKLYQRRKEGTETFPTPFSGLNKLLRGGLRRKGVTILSGWTAYGKSLTLDLMLEHLARRGLRVHVFSNEMSAEERGFRIASRQTGIPADVLQRADTLDEPEFEMPFGITDCTDMSIEDVARVIRRGRFDVIGIDHLHRFPYRDERDIAEMSSAVNRAASAGDCHVIACAHLSEHRARQGKLPAPDLGDLRGSGMLKNDPDNVMFIHREMSDANTATDTSAMFVRKSRYGVPGIVKLQFDGRRARFLETTEQT